MCLKLTKRCDFRVYHQSNHCSGALPRSYAPNHSNKYQLYCNIEPQTAVLLGCPSTNCERRAMGFVSFFKRKRVDRIRYLFLEWVQLYLERVFVKLFDAFKIADGMCFECMRLVKLVIVQLLCNSFCALNSVKLNKHNSSRFNK